MRLGHGLPGGCRPGSVPRPTRPNFSSTQSPVANCGPHSQTCMWFMKGSRNLFATRARSSQAVRGSPLFYPTCRDVTFKCSISYGIPCPPTTEESLLRCGNQWPQYSRREHGQGRGASLKINTFFSGKGAGGPPRPGCGNKESVQAP